MLVPLAHRSLYLIGHHVAVRTLDPGGATCGQWQGQIPICHYDKGPSSDDDVQLRGLRNIMIFRHSIKNGWSIHCGLH